MSKANDASTHNMKMDGVAMRKNSATPPPPSRLPAGKAPPPPPTSGKKGTWTFAVLRPLSSASKVG